MEEVSPALCTFKVQACTPQSRSQGKELLGAVALIVLLLAQVAVKPGAESEGPT